MPLPAPPGRGGAAGALDTGLAEVGTGGFPGTLGLAPTGGGAGLGFAATGGGGFDPTVLVGREGMGLESLESDAATFFFQGAADPFAGIMLGNTATGLA